MSILRGKGFHECYWGESEDTGLSLHDKKRELKPTTPHNVTFTSPESNKRTCPRPTTPQRAICDQINCGFPIGCNRAFLLFKQARKQYPLTKPSADSGNKATSVAGTSSLSEAKDDDVTPLRKNKKNRQKKSTTQDSNRMKVFWNVFQKEQLPRKVHPLLLFLLRPRNSPATLVEEFILCNWEKGWPELLLVRRRHPLRYRPSKVNDHRRWK